MGVMCSVLGALAVVAIGESIPHLRLEPPGALHAFFTGDSFFVTCFAREDSGATRLTWQGATGKDITVSKGRVHVEPSPHSPLGLELVVEEVKYKDQGSYMCSAVVDGVEVKTRFAVIVHQSIAFWGTPVEQQGTEGSDFLLQCIVRADPTPIISWYVNGSLILNGPRCTQTEDGLFMRSLKRTDAGNYTCRAFVITPHNSQMKDIHIRLDVHYRPVWHKPHMEVTYGLVGGTGHLVCEAHSQPPPVFEWFRERALLGNSRLYRIINGKWKSILQVKILDNTAFGNYQCVVSNTLGEVHRYIALFEGVFPNAPKVQVVSDEPGTLTVHLTPSDDDPLPVIGYRIQYRLKRNEWTTTSQQYVYNDNKLVLQDLNFEMVYVVRAKARNLVGYSNYSEEVSQRTRGPVAETVLDNPGVSSLSNSSPLQQLHTLPCSFYVFTVSILICLPIINRIT